MQVPSLCNVRDLSVHPHVGKNTPIVKKHNFLTVVRNRQEISRRQHIFYNSERDFKIAG